MRNIEFNDKKTKEMYQKTIKSNRGLSGIMALLINDGQGIKIMNVEDYDYGNLITIKKNDEMIYVYTDLLKKKIYVDNPNEVCMKIFDDYPRKNIVPRGYLYKNNERTITKQLFFNLNDKHDTNNYELKENENQYLIIIKDNSEMFNEEGFIERLLNSKIKFDSIRNVFLAIQCFIDTNKINLVIGDAKGSSIVINNGSISKYVEYYEEDDHYNKIYLEDGEFYVEKRIKEPYSDNLTSYMKKLGERNGKEKR